MFGLFNAARDANNPASTMMTPDSIKERRAMARALLQRGSDTSPVQHWSQGAARLVDALSGTLDDFAATRGEQAGLASAREAEKGLFGMMGGGGGGDTPTPSATPSAATPAPVSGDKEQVARTVYDRLVEGGLTPVAAAGLVGNIKMESSFNTGARNPGDGRDGSDSIGLVQWNSGRAQALKAHAAQTARDWRDPAVQADFIVQELNGPERRARDLIMSAQTPEDAGRNAIAFFRPAGFTWQNPAGGHNAAARIAAARAFAGQFGGQRTAPMPTMGDLADRGDMTGTQGDLVDRGDGRYQMARLPNVMSDAAPSMPQADAPSPQAQPAQFAVPQQRATPAAPNDNARLRAALAVLNNPFSSPGAKALAQQALSQERKDPRDGVIKDLTIEEKRRQLGRVEMETMTAPDGTVFEREKGKAGAQWQQTLRLPQKPEAGTTDQRELAQINTERQAAGQPRLTMEEYQRAKAETTRQTRRTLQPVFGTNDAGETVMLQPGDDGTAVQTQLPPGVRVASGVDRIDAGTKFILLDKRTGQVVGEQPKDLRGAEREKGIGEAEGKAAANIGSTVATADQTLSTIDGVLNDKNLNFTLSPAGMAARNIPFTQSTGTMARIEQLQGRAFLQAFESLKGGGAITEIEGQKATQAIARLGANQSPKDFREALAELRGIVTAARERATRGVQRSGQPVPEQPAPQPQPGWRDMGNGVRIREKAQ
jgi:hypothetical protein